MISASCIRLEKGKEEEEDGRGRWFTAVDSGKRGGWLTVGKRGRWLIVKKGEAG